MNNVQWNNVRTPQIRHFCVSQKAARDEKRESLCSSKHCPPPPLLYPHNVSNTHHSATMNTLKSPEGSRQHFITPLKQTDLGEKAMMHLRERESLSSVRFLLLLYLYFYPYTFDCTCPYFNFIHWSKYNLCTFSFSILVLPLLELYLFLRSCPLVLLYSSASSFSFLNLHCCTRHLRHYPNAAPIQ